MRTDFTTHITNTAHKIIDLSHTLDTEIETWQDVIARVPDSTSKGVSTGFVSKPNPASGIELVIDVQAPPTEQTAHLRIWAIETTKDDSNNERFNNIQLTYQLDYDKARELVERSDTPTRDDFLALARDPANYLETIVVSDLTGKDATSEQLLGKRYDLQQDELRTMSDDLSSELIAATDSILERLEASATTH